MDVNSVNGRYCTRLKIYVEHAHVKQCELLNNSNIPNIMSNPNTPATPVQALAARRENIAVILQSAPDSYQRNVQSANNCIAAGQRLLDKINEQGMTDELDQQAARYLERTRLTVKEMNERRAPLTKLFDQVRSEFTALENSIDPAKDTVPARLRHLRDDYAAELRRQEEARREAERAARMQAQARTDYRAACDDDYRTQFNRMLSEHINSLTQLSAAVTLETYESVLAAVSAYSVELPADWAPTSVIAPPIQLSADECAAIRRESLTQLRPFFAEQYRFEMEDLRYDTLDRLPSKKAELERAATASAEEAARVKAELAAREAEDVARRERERQAKAEAERQQAELAKAKAEMNEAFTAASMAVPVYTVKSKVTKRIDITSPEAILPIISMWWKYEGCNMSVEDLAKTFRKQITFCEKLATKENILVEAHGLEYTEEVKAR